MPTTVRKRYFTVSEANALLPRIRPRITRMMQLRACLRTDDEGHPIPMPPGTPWLADPVVAAWNAQAPQTDALTSAIEDTLQSEQAALTSLGVLVKDLGLGLLDFPSYLDGQTEVELCWQVSESEVRFFHSKTAGYGSRRSIEGHTFSSERKSAGQLSG